MGKDKARSRTQSDAEDADGRCSVPCCQIEGCQADLLADKAYNLKKRLCSAHMGAHAVFRRDQPGQAWRFCFQCGKLEPLELFDGKQRSCRNRLMMRRKPSKRSSRGNLDCPAQLLLLQQQQQQPDHRAKRSRSAGSHECCQSQSPDTQHSTCDDQQLQAMMQWQHPPAQQGVLNLQACWATAVGSCADSAQETHAARAPAAAAGGAAAATAAARQQQCLASLAAGAQEAAAQLNSLRRASTALSAADVAVLLANQQPRTRAESAPAMGAAPAASAAGGSIAPAAAFSGHIASLQQQCKELQAKLNSVLPAAPAAAAAAAGRDAGGPALQPACSLASANAAAGPAAAAHALRAHTPVVPAVSGHMLLQQKQPAVSLQCSGSWESTCPSSPVSAATGMLPAASHMELVEMVVQQLEDSSASAEADELEAMLDQELRAAATLPPEHAKNSWASQVTQMIDNLSCALSCSAMPQASAGCSQLQPMLPAGFVPTAAVPAASAQGAAAALAGKHLGGFTPVLSPAGSAVPAAMVENLVDLKLVALQQQLAQLQVMVQGLRGQFVV